MALPTDIIVFSTADWSQANWTNNQHMSQVLADQGFRILYLESLGLRQPTANSRDLRRIGQRLLKSMRGLRQVAPGIWVFSPLVIPFHRSPVVRQLNQTIVVNTVKLLSRWLGFQRPIAWVYNPIVASFQAQLQPAFLVYHCVDDLTTVPGIAPEVVATAERTLIQAADLVFVTSQPLQEKLAAIAPDKVHYFPNVADYQHFAQARDPGPVPKDLMAIPQPRIGFIGAIKDYKLDVELIITLGQQHPDWHWVMIGEVELTNAHQLAAFQQLPNVHFLGYRPYRSLPDYLRGIDVAVLPCQLNDYTRAMFPMKFFEYLAAGRPVVGTRLPSLTPYESLYRPTQSVDEFAQALGEAIAGHGPDRDAGIQAAQDHTWSRRCQQMVTLMQRVWQRRSTPISSTPLPR